MLASSIDQVTQSAVTGPRFRKALEWLRDTDLESVPLGRNEIDGDEVFANVMEFVTVPAAEKSFEAHRRYADIHYVISGEEALGVSPVTELRALGEFDEADDFCLYDDPQRTSWVVLRPGELCVTPPADAHKPGCCVSGPATLRKVCVKVLMD